MTEMAEEVKKAFGQKLRVRVCGICLQGHQILLVNHRGLGISNNFWAPPGGGMNFGESAAATLQREFVEETGLHVETSKFLFVNEYIGKQLHAIELFFQVHVLSGNLQTGTDPELDQKEQIIKEVKFMSLQDLKQYQQDELHSIFHQCQDLEEILQTNGYICMK